MKCEIIEDKEQLYDKCENMEQLYDKYYYLLLVENQELKKQKEELRDYLKARIEVCDNRLSTPFCNFEKATKERLILSQCLDKLEELEGVSNE